MHQRRIAAFAAPTTPALLFSHMNITGSRHSEAMFRASKLTPSSSAPSPKNAIVTEPSRRWRQA